MGVRGWLLVLGEFFGESVSKKWLIHAVLLRSGAYNFFVAMDGGCDFGLYKPLACYFVALFGAVWRLKG